MNNKEISRALRLCASLGEIHGENEFKLKSLVNGAFQIDRSGVPLSGMTLEQILEIPGIGKGIGHKVIELLETGTTEELEAYRKITPPGIIELLSVKGIGPKKILTLWKELGIESPGELLYACNENRLIELKGFGAKTQQQISDTLQYKLSSRGKLHYSDALLLAQAIQKQLLDQNPNAESFISGELRRNMETCSDIILLVMLELKVLQEIVSNIPELLLQEEKENILIYRFAEHYTVKLVSTNSFDLASDLLYFTGPEKHLTEIGFLKGLKLNSEDDFYKEKHLTSVLPELRDLPLQQALAINPEELVGFDDIKGCIHTHTTWSDGVNSTREMAEACISLGYQYLVVSDHSRSAFYARGLSIESVLRQHDEIDQLNEQLAPFKIFKSIESDILHDGALDYPDDILARFDLVIASVHSVLRMDIQKATARIMAALENPYTTMLGHPSGRLLLSREAYPLDYEKLIETAAQNKVVIELNANRFRMDIDWRYIPMCREKSVMISVNPDAHQKETITDMRYGIDIARKGGLSKPGLFNGLSRTELESWLKQRRIAYSGSSASH
jgi:DNA polymerase (family X)